MSRTKDLAKSTFSILASQSLTTTISIVFIAYFARVFSKDQMAVYATLTMLSGWTATISSMGMGTLMEKEVAQLEAAGEHDLARSQVSSVILYRTLLMILVSLVFFWVSPGITLKFFGNHEYVNLIRYVVVIGFVMAFAGTLSTIQVAGQRFISRSLIDFATLLSQRVFCVIGFVYAGIYGFFSGILLGTLIGIILCLFDVRKYLTWRFISFSELFGKSKGYFGLNMIKLATDQIDRPVVAFFLGAEALAGYHVAKRLYDNLCGLVVAVELPAGIKLGEVKVEGPAALNSYYNRCLIVIAHLFIPLGCFLMVVAKSLLLLYGGEKYISSSPVLATFGFTLMGLGLWLMVRQAGLRLVSVRYLVYQYLVTSAVTFSAYGLLLPLVGETGLPVAMGLGYIAGFISLAYQLQKQWQLKLPCRQLFSSCCCGLCVLVMALPAAMVMPGMVHLAITCILSGLVYLAWLKLFGPLEVETLLRNVSGRIPVFRVIFAR